jgi:hypothetical protein
VALEKLPVGAKRALILGSGIAVLSGGAALWVLSPVPAQPPLAPLSAELTAIIAAGPAPNSKRPRCPLDYPGTHTYGTVTPELS